jgi:hypothetical protein
MWHFSIGFGDGLSTNKTVKFFVSIKSPSPLNGGYLWGSHHPHCDRHHNHLIWIAGHPFCLGCTCMYTGIVLGVPLAFAIQWSNIDLWQWFALHMILLLPTVLQIRIQRKSFKMTARFLLGITTSLYLVSGMLLLPINLWVRLLILVVFSFLYFALRRLRNRYISSPCDNCPLGRYPVCEWNMPRFLADNDIPLLKDALSSDELKNLIIK